MAILNYVAFWFLFPLELRSQKELRKQAKVFVMYRILRTTQGVTMQMISLAAIRMQPSLQWILALIIPVCRNISSTAGIKIAETTPETNKDDVKFLVRSQFSIFYILLVTTRLTSLHQSTVSCILIVELLLHMIDCYQIMKMKTKIEENNHVYVNNTLRNERQVQINTLLVNEFLEAILPLAYGITFTMAYYGPNSTLFKGAGNEYFGTEIITDIKNFYIVLVQMLSIDLLAMAVSGVSLNYQCNINLFQELCNMMKKYWLIFLVKLPTIAMNFGQKDVNMGQDYTLKFEWITNEGRFNLIRNSIELSNEEKSFLLGNSTI